jgi:hypothetical protein
MRVMVFVKSTADIEKYGVPDTPKTKAMMAAMEKYNDELREAGILKMAEGLKISKHGKRVTFDGPDRKVVDGPFNHPSDLVAGFWLWEVKDMEEAVAWVKRCPNPMAGPGVIEIRPIAEGGDHG